LPEKEKEKSANGLFGGLLFIEGTEDTKFFGDKKSEREMLPFALGLEYWFNYGILVRRPEYVVLISERFAPKDICELIVLAESPNAS